MTRDERPDGTPGSPARVACIRGMRISWTDAAVLALVLGGSWLGRERLGDLAPLPGFVLLHFFLFCNVFRVRRAYELIWSAAFLANAAHALGATPIAWGALLARQTPVTLLLIALEIASPRYHGIFSRSCAGNHH